MTINRAIILAWQALLLSALFICTLPPAFSQPATTKPNASNTLSQCLANVPLIGNGSGTSPICSGSGALGAAAFLPSTMTVNGSTCMLGGSCSPGAGAIAVGDTVTGGTNNGIFYNNAGSLGNTTAGINGQLLLGMTSANPQWSSMSGDATISNAGVLTLGSIITAGGPTGSATVAPIITYDAKGRLMTVNSATITPAAGSITGAAALTKVNDTNVTLTLGGAPGTALLAATSIAAGWTGTLANARLATMATNTVKGNATSGTASPTDLAVSSCSSAASALIWTTNTGFGCNTAITANAVPAANLTGVTLASGVTGSSLTSLGTIASLIATTAAVNTSVTTPVVAGGSGAASTLSLESTSGAGTTDAIRFLTGSQVYRGGISTSGQFTIGPEVAAIAGVKLTVNNNTVAPASSGAFTPAIQGVGADGSSLFQTFDVFGTGAANFIALRSARGTLASFTATQSGDTLGGFLGFTGATGANTFGAISGTAGGAYIGASATENWSAGSQGAKLILYTTPNTTAGIVQAMQVNSSGGLSIGTTTDPLVGGLQVNGQSFMPNSLSDSGLADSTACIRTSNGQILKGSGTLGICLGTSGAQFKTAIAPMVAGLAEVEKLALVNYRYRAGFGDNGERVQYGLTAQQVAAVMPDLVRYDENGEALNFDIGALLPVALHALQQLKSANDDLRACQEHWKCRLFGMK